jgi:hypothetical protein
MLSIELERMLEERRLVRIDNALELLDKKAKLLGGEKAVKNIERYNSEVEGLLSQPGLKIVRYLSFRGDTFYVEFQRHNQRVQNVSRAIWRLRWRKEEVEETLLGLEITEEARKIPTSSAKYIHVFNEEVGDWNNYLHTFKEIQGEVCVSSPEDSWLCRRERYIAVMVEAVPTASFTYDCWSIRREDGSRLATRRAGNNYRTEHWVVPARSKIVKVITKGENEQVMAACKELEIPVEVM